MKGNIFLIPYDRLGAFVDGPGRHAEEGLFGIIAAADYQAEHLVHFAVFIEISGCDNGKTAGKKEILDAIKVFNRSVRLFLLLFISAQQKQHRAPPDEFGARGGKIGNRISAHYCLIECKISAKRGKADILKNSFARQ